MDIQITRTFLALTATLPLTALAGGAQKMTSSEWGSVAQALGKTGDLNPGNVYRVAFPRSDLNVSVNGVKIQTALSLGSYAAFLQHSNGAMVMGDLVLTEAELNPVMNQLQQTGFMVTAVHKHLPDETPRIWWMHYIGTGNAMKLASSLKIALALTKTPMTSQPSTPNLGNLNTGALDALLGRKGKVNGSVYSYSVPRAEQITMDGTVLPPATGVTTAINFEPLDQDRAAINGDFVMTADEVNPVLAALRRNGIEVVTVHNHMLNEEPRLFFSHFWAVDDAQKLAKGLREALDATHSQRP